MKKAIFATLATVIALGSVSAPAFANTYEKDDISIGWGKKKFDFVKSRKVRRMDNITVNGVTVWVKGFKKNDQCKFSVNAFKAGIHDSMKEIVAYGLTTIEDGMGDITRVKINGGKNKEYQGTNMIQETVEIFNRNGGGVVTFYHNDKEDIKKSIGFDTIRRHYCSDFLQTAINEVHKKLKAKGKTNTQIENNADDANVAIINLTTPNNK